jgi:hypothetical protein
LKYKRVRPAIKGRFALLSRHQSGCRNGAASGDRVPCTQMAGIDMTVVM